MADRDLYSHLDEKGLQWAIENGTDGIRLIPEWEVRLMNLELERRKEIRAEGERTKEQKIEEAVRKAREEKARLWVQIEQRVEADRQRKEREREQRRVQEAQRAEELRQREAARQNEQERKAGQPERLGNRNATGDERQHNMGAEWDAGRRASIERHPDRIAEADAQPKRTEEPERDHERERKRDRGGYGYER